MGMFDDLRCHYPLPVAGANARSYQTKDTPCQYMNKYEITAEGVLRHQKWHPEDGTSDTWIEHPDFTGEVRFYDYEHHNGGGHIEFSSYFVNGVLKEVHLIIDTTRASAPTPPPPPGPQSER